MLYSILSYPWIPLVPRQDPKGKIAGTVKSLHFTEKGIEALGGEATGHTDH